MNRKVKNHFNLERNINWAMFRYDMIALGESFGSEYFIKGDLSMVV